tara:strand:- start:191 stop:841 length:651 start_codon:yes stop_codon:yes gene_type:complete
MAIHIGMKNASDKGFSEEEIEVAHGFQFGLLCINAGVGDIGERKHGVTITPEEAHERFALTMKLFGFVKEGISLNSFIYTWLSDLENIKRLAENDWTCNVNNETTEHFLHKMRNLSLSRQLEDEKFTHLKSNIGEMSADTVCEQQEAARTIIGSLLSGTVRMDSDNKEWYIDTLTEAFGVWEWQGPFDMEKPFYDGKYLCYADGTHYLSSTPQEDE